jgi:hypothetical protein
MSQCEPKVPTLHWLWKVIASSLGAWEIEMTYESCVPHHTLNRTMQRLFHQFHLSTRINMSKITVPGLWYMWVIRVECCRRRRQHNKLALHTTSSEQTRSRSEWRVGCPLSVCTIFLFHRGAKKRLRRGRLKKPLAIYCFCTTLPQRT